MSSPAADPAGRPFPEAGFMLLEVLVALVIAGLVLGAVGAALAQGWRSTRVPLDVLSAVTVARVELARPPGALATGPAPAGFSVTRRLATPVILPRSSPVAPAPRAARLESASGGPRRDDTMPGVTHHTPDAGGGSGRLEAVTLVVTTPSGRRVGLDTVRLDAVPE